MPGKWMSGVVTGVKSEEHDLLGGHMQTPAVPGQRWPQGVTWPIGRIKGRVLGQCCHSRRACFMLTGSSSVLSAQDLYSLK